MKALCDGLSLLKSLQFLNLRFYEFDYQFVRLFNYLKRIVTVSDQDFEDLSQGIKCYHH